tara:strand:- start:122 stop:268 length:147 start_codon:yes stop_codon:yes gene_type:complete
MTPEDKEKKIKIKKNNEDQTLAINYTENGDSISNTRSGITYIPKKNGK